MNPSVSIFTPDHRKPHRDSTGSAQDGLHPGSKTSTPLPRSPGPSLLTPNSNADLTPGSETVGTPTDKGGWKLTRKESYKAQRKSYRQEKKRFADELLSSLNDPSVIVLADWLKVRGTLKSWTKLHCVLKPGLLLLYKSPKTKSNHWVGTVLLNACQVIERPSKKDGFCFKLFHPMEQSIWAPKGPEKESIGAVVQPLPTSYLIFRAPSQAAGKCWLDALELALRCSSLIVRSLSKHDTHDQDQDQDQSSSVNPQWSEADFEKHFVDYAGSEHLTNLLDVFSPKTPTNEQQLLLPQWRPSPSPLGLTLPVEVEQLATPCPSPTPLFPGLYHALAELENAYPNALIQSSGDSVDLGGGGADAGSGAEQMSISDTESDVSHHGEPDNFDVDVDADADAEQDLPETPYIARVEGEMGMAGEQVEELAEEHKSLIWFLVKQVRPGMDLSKVVLPTFILEPRSFLDKLSDSYYHADILSKAVLEDDAFTRMKTVVQWYLSGFYKKPKGLKKPYNPVLGETFRCFWKHPTGSRTFYIAEQVSHHPPISAFYVTNRQDGFCISGSILAKSKFYGNSTSAILDGVAVLTLLPRGEEYTITIPYALCKGILMGTLTMEYGGKVAVECEKTGYKTELEFKLKPFIGGADHINAITGKLKLGKETLATIDGYWDSCIKIRDKRSGEEQVLWNPTPTVRATRLIRHTVPIQEQENFESERLWEKVSAAIVSDDQMKATEEKTILEDAQREAVRERKKSGCDWVPKLFEINAITGSWDYKHCDLRPWDPRNDLLQYETNYVVCTKTRHQTPMIRTASIISVDHPNVHLETRSLKTSKRRMAPAHRQESVSSSQEAHSDSSQWEHSKHNVHQFRPSARVLERLRQMELTMQVNCERLQKLQSSLELMARAQRERERAVHHSRGLLASFHVETFLVIAIIFLFQILLVWMFFKRQ